MAWKAKLRQLTSMKVEPRVNLKFPFLGCSPDGIVGNDTVKGLKILKLYSLEAVTSPTSLVPKSQCFKVENGKLILKLCHKYYYPCQQILLVTGQENCDFILHAASGPDSVQRIPRDELLIEKILSYLTELYMRFIARKIFEIRVPWNLLPFLLPPFGSPDIHTYIHNLYLTWEKRLAIAILQVFHKLILRKKEICTQECKDVKYHASKITKFG